MEKKKRKDKLFTTQLRDEGPILKSKRPKYLNL